MNTSPWVMNAGAVNVSGVNMACCCIAATCSVVSLSFGCFPRLKMGTVGRFKHVYRVTPLRFPLSGLVWRKATRLRARA